MCTLNPFLEDLLLFPHLTRPAVSCMFSCVAAHTLTLLFSPSPTVRLTRVCDVVTAEARFDAKTTKTTSSVADSTHTYFGSEAAAAAAALNTLISPPQRMLLLLCMMSAFFTPQEMLLPMFSLSYFARCFSLLVRSIENLPSPFVSTRLTKHGEMRQIELRPLMLADVACC